MKHKKLQIDELNFVQAELSYKSKSLNGSYALGIFLGFLGIHRAYLEKPKSGMIRAIMSFATIVIGGLVLAAETGSNASEAGVFGSLLGLLFIVLLGVSIIWWIADLFQISKWVDEINTRNEEVAVEKAIQSRYVEEHILKKQVVDEVMSTIMSKVKVTINEELDARQLHRKEKSGVDPNFPRLPSPELDITNLTGDLMGVNTGSSTEEINQLGKDILGKLTSEDFNEVSSPNVSILDDKEFEVEQDDLSDRRDYQSSLEEIIMTEVIAMIKKTLDEMEAADLIQEHVEINVAEYMSLNDSVDDNSLYEELEAKLLSDEESVITPDIEVEIPPEIVIDGLESQELERYPVKEQSTTEDSHQDAPSGLYSDATDVDEDAPSIINEQIEVVLETAPEVLDEVEELVEVEEIEITVIPEEIKAPVIDVIINPKEVSVDKSTEESKVDKGVEIEIIEAPETVEEPKLEVVINKVVENIETDELLSKHEPIYMDIIETPEVEVIVNPIIDVVIKEVVKDEIVESLIVKKESISIEIIDRPEPEVIEEPEVIDEPTIEKEIEYDEFGYAYDPESRYADINYDELAANKAMDLSEDKFKGFRDRELSSSGKILRSRDITARDLIDIVEGSNRPTSKRQLPSYDTPIIDAKETTDWESINLKPLYGNEKSEVDKVRNLAKLSEEERRRLEKSENVKIIGDVVIDNEKYEQRRARALKASAKRAQDDMIESEKSPSESKKKSKGRLGLFRKK